MYNLYLLFWRNWGTAAGSFLHESDRSCTKLIVLAWKLSFLHKTDRSCTKLIILARKWSFLHKTEHRAAHAAEQLCIIVLVSCMMRPTPTPCAVGHNATRVESARTVYTQNRVWPYVWRFPCQKYRTYTVYTYECMVLANSTNVPNKARQITSICTNSSAVGLHTKQNNWPTFSQWITNGLCVSQCTRANGQHSRRSNWPAHKAHQLTSTQSTTICVQTRNSAHKAHQLACTQGTVTGQHTRHSKWPAN